MKSENFHSVKRCSMTLCFHSEIGVFEDMSDPVFGAGQPVFALRNAGVVE